MSVDNRIQVLDNPIAAPGSCAICGYSGGAIMDERKFIDWGFSLDFYGAVILCSHCVENVANALGYSSPVQVEHLKLVNINLVESNQRLEAENVRLRAALSNLDFLPNLPKLSVSAKQAEGLADSGSDEPDSIDESDRSENVSDSKRNLRKSSDDLFKL